VTEVDRNPGQYRAQVISDPPSRLAAQAIAYARSMLKQVRRFVRFWTLRRQILGTLLHRTRPQPRARDMTVRKPLICFPRTAPALWLERRLLRLHPMLVGCIPCHRFRRHAAPLREVAQQAPRRAKGGLETLRLSADARERLTRALRSGGPRSDSARILNSSVLLHLILHHQEKLQCKPQTSPDH
jgi:hypothetical protein